MEDLSGLFALFPMSHGGCFLWTWDILAAFIMGNGSTAAAWIAMSGGFFYGALRLKEVGAPKFLLYNCVITGLFLFLCGVGHVINLANVWLGMYRLEAYWSVLTGSVALIELAVLVTTRKVILQSVKQLIEGTPYHE